MGIITDRDRDNKVMNDIGIYDMKIDDDRPRQIRFNKLGEEIIFTEKKKNRRTKKVSL